jgi:hypothetical protein
MNARTEVPADRLERPHGNWIAYNRVEGAGPGVVFLPGFKSDMGGTKAMVLDRFCRDRGQGYLRFDYGSAPGPMTRSPPSMS